MDKKRYQDLERILKGAGSHWRIQIMDTLEKHSELSVMELAEHLSADYRTLSEHLRKLSIAGLLMKRHEGASVRHALTERGKNVLKFCRTLE
ncbi:MAG: Uncharacterized protein Greene07147_87 [Parcubacteria group bacterium Greene0714_7]|nr:MAG: Uncharacterized protein Greene07147_87 [Parcubacteria group bacterium Greene0714_7]